MPEQFDIAIIGAGIAGASLASELMQAEAGRVAVLDMEDQPGYHTTGRSAAIFAPIYGPAPIRALTRASEPFFRNPSEGFTKNALFSPRSSLMIARQDQMQELQALEDAVRDEGDIRRLGASELLRVQPVLRPGYAVAGLYDTSGQDIDVAALHQGYLRRFRGLGGEIRLRSAVSGLTRTSGRWRIETRADAIECDILVNAAGAWAGELGHMAGAEDIGLTPKRRTAVTIAAPGGFDLSKMPITVDIAERFYLKPEVGQFLLSPADETPSTPCDAQPDELDVALCIDRIETAFDLKVRRIAAKWAGLRSFVADGVPVIGFSGNAEGFFWLAGQGGYGIQSAPAVAQFAAARILDREADSRLVEAGFDPSTVAPRRLQPPGST